MTAAESSWQHAESAFDPGLGARASIGIVALSSDRVGVWDAERFLAGVPGIAVFSTRIPMAAVGTPETLREMAGHLSGASEVLMTGTPLDVVGFSCTSGTVAIGPAEVRKSIQAARPGVPVATPVEAGAKALKLFGVRRMSLLVPYIVPTAELISGFFESAGFAIDRRATFGLDGDPQINALSGEAIVGAARACMHPDSEGMFISCTGLRTSGLVSRIESAIGRPVVTSNQALAWDCLRSAGIDDRIDGEGMLLSNF